MKKYILILSLLAIVLFPKTFAEEYTTELQSAYGYAYTVGITTQGSIDSADMYGSLIRAHMAKMMVNYTKEVLGKKPNTSLACNFTDIAEQSAELKGYIKEACQLGLMGQDITAFKPNDVVTRAQFGTVLSRAVYNENYNGGNPYYLLHLQALQQAKIMTNISSPAANEIRGYVMLMLMRSNQEGETSQGSPSVCTPENELLCLVGSSNCPAECQNTDNAATAGTLQVATTTTAVGKLPENTKYIGSLKLTANDADITIKSLNFQKVGNFTQGWIEDDQVKIKTLQNREADATITTTFSPGITIKSGTSKLLNIFAEDTSQDQGVSLLNMTSIQSSANTISGGFPIRLVK